MTPAHTFPAMEQARSNKLRWLREWWRAIGIGALLCIAVIAYGPASNADRATSDSLLTIQKRGASKDLLLVEITPADLREYGRPLMSRENQARLLNSIASAGPERVLFDLYLAERIDPEADAQMERALARFGKDRLGLVSAPGPNDLPDPMFAQHGTILDARLTPAVDGWHRALGRARGERGANPARWLAEGTFDPTPVAIDIGIDHSGYDRVDAGAVIEGKVDLAGRTIIVSAGPDVAPTRAYLPRSESASRAVVIATATQSVAQGFDETSEIGGWANRGLQLFGALLGLLCAAIASSGRRLVALAAASLAVLMVSHVSLAGHMGVAVTPTIAVTCFFIMLNATLFRRLRVMSLMTNFLRGDLSPEEAWAWRVSEQSPFPAMLFAADGRVKRANAAASDLSARYSDEIAALALPRPGEKASEIEFDSHAGLPLCFELEWPFEHLPIARLRDVSVARSAQRDLMAQLNRDELTGCLNRRGLKEELARLTEQRADYAAFYIDLNGFKQVNDTYGHDVGDDLLVKAAKALRAMTRGDAAIARLGGDEFAVVIEGSSSSSQGELVASRIADALDISFSKDDISAQAKIAGAVGFASPRYHGEDPDEVIRRADQMMYRRKSEMKRVPQAA